MFNGYLGAVLCVTGSLLSGCKGSGKAYASARELNASAGEQVILQYRCGSCHTIPGVHDAHGLVGPPLLEFGRRTMIAGDFPNDQNHLVRWVMSPTSMKPKTAMPDLGLSEQEARDVATYLSTIR